jgi:lysozyme family protein
MADYKRLVPFIRKWEGGFVNDPYDKGGATNAGVTIATYRAYRKQKGYATTSVDDLKGMTSVEWQEIFKKLYWDRWRADGIRSQSVADILVDWVWASGVWGIKIPQRLLGVTVDGVVGPVTLETLNRLEARKIFDTIKSARVQFIDDICRRTPTNERFRRGWMNRLNDIRFEE